MNAKDRALTWYDESYERAYEAVITRLVYVDTLNTGDLVVDRWTDPGRVDAVIVVNVPPGVGAEQAYGQMPDWDALAWEADVTVDPTARLREALLQGHCRAQERLTGDVGVAILPR